MKRVAILLVPGFIGLATTIALAHDAWMNGREVDPWTKRVCCGQHDAFRLEPATVHATKEGYRLDTGEVIPYARAQPSPDGQFWKFVWGNQIQCFFAPPPSI